MSAPGAVYLRAAQEILNLFTRLRTVLLCAKFRRSVKQSRWHSLANLSEPRKPNLVRLRHQRLPLLVFVVLPAKLADRLLCHPDAAHPPLLILGLPSLRPGNCMPHPRALELNNKPWREHSVALLVLRVLTTVLEPCPSLRPFCLHNSNVMKVCEHNKLNMLPSFNSPLLNRNCQHESCNIPSGR